MDTPRHPIAGPRPLPPQPTRSQNLQHTQPAQYTRRPSTRSPAERTTQSFSSNSTRRNFLDPVMEGDTRLLRDVYSPPPGDVRVSRRMSNPDVARQRSQYFERAFATKEQGLQDHPMRASSIVLCEVKTNVTIRDDATFFKDLSHHLATRYQRPLSSIVVTVENTRICFAGSYDPAYSIAIHALASQSAQTVTNKRNLCLLQKHLTHALGVAPDRGLVRFVGVPEECLGWGGNTVAGEVANNQMRTHRGRTKDSEGSNANEKRGAVRSLSHRFRAGHSKAQPSETATRYSRATTLAPAEPVSISGVLAQAKGVEAGPAKEPLSRRSSFLHGLFGRS